MAFDRDNPAQQKANPSPHEQAADGAIVLDGVGVTRFGTSILEGITATLPAGSLVGLVGPNGAGKTTLLHAMLGLVAFRGTIDLGVPRSRVGFVPQRLDFDRTLPIRVVDFLVMPHQRRPLWLGVSRAWRLKAEAALTEVDALHLLHAPMGQLSGGEAQRVMLAGALMGEPRLLLLDEPVSGVDVAGEAQFYALLDRLRRTRGMTVVLVSHDIHTIAEHADVILAIHRRLIAVGPPSEVDPDWHAAGHSMHRH